MHGWFYDGGYMMGIHGVWWLALLVVTGGILLSGWGRFTDRTDTGREAPHEVLRRRLANGDITAAEYEERKALLDRDGGRST
ncbi:SHOCT domain-containing protein [Polaromonas sp.]|uniref:SHOCT domain-containing protein n=1 Tax=Polaromonas sp. TaxID=1869339 RepID=UPI00272FDEDE|nr:SHOCT domain-containing protein [Polaromonas sp.]MDP1741660.1 SHOCT domain-containing protein [Polaromonas sp.]